MSKNIKTDRFGQPYQNVACKNNKNGYPVGYAELGGKLYKIEPGGSSDGVDQWVKITKVDAKKRHSSM
ncbi:hypothetical protein Q361_10944 [Flavobacterium croceum DSM 17960]|uniref:Uncharacterized protein n=1 Tax=Flavobacterium croceum DSM 17960 TaxID=1121886 RepID=A0A2S4N794_9FLAO|nr:hypothetical protein [Flavobacterium croceum]POS01584.1 hypothetical protein Q361_10944 [Flavobacterium croceum DSM 17960]